MDGSRFVKEPFDWHDQFTGATILQPGDPDVDAFDQTIDSTAQGDEPIAMEYIPEPDEPTV